MLFNSKEFLMASRAEREVSVSALRSTGTHGRSSSTTKEAPALTKEAAAPTKETAALAAAPAV